MRIWLATLMILAFSSGAMSQSPDEKLRILFEDAAAKHAPLALGLAHARGDAAPKTMVSGPQSVKRPATVQSDARWHVGSITKSFTAVLVLQSVERGVLDLDTPVGTYLSRFSSGMHADWQSRSLRQLLSHTAGLPGKTPLGQMLKSHSADAAKARIDVLGAQWSKPLKPPGTFEYSNTGYILAALVLEEVTGHPWEALVRTEIAEPLGLKSVGNGPPDQSGDPWGHRSILGFKRPADPASESADNPAWLGPAGRLHMTLEDLVKWGQAHMRACNGETIAGFISPESCRTMQTEVADSYGLGWVVQSQTDLDVPVIWHNGSNTMWYAVLAMVPDHDAVIAVVLNAYDAPAIDALTQQMLAALTGVEPVGYER